nr:MAG TPA_asm: hypothetical protein [Caudoviricetes sp.]
MRKDRFPERILHIQYMLVEYGLIGRITKVADILFLEM